MENPDDCPLSLKLELSITYVPSAAVVTVTLVAPLRKVLIGLREKEIETPAMGALVTEFRTVPRTTVPPGASVKSRITGSDGCAPRSGTAPGGASKYPDAPT
jgi:hypothetical protein